MTGGQSEARHAGARQCAQYEFAANKPPMAPDKLTV